MGSAAALAPLVPCARWPCALRFLAAAARSRRGSGGSSDGLLDVSAQALHGGPRQDGRAGLGRSQMLWEIRGEGEELNPGGYDGRVWRWRVCKETDTVDQRQVLVGISGTVLSTAVQVLPERVAAARRTRGRSEVEMMLDWPEPPAKLNIHSHGVSPEGGDPGPAQREISEIVKWFDERGDALGREVGARSTPALVAAGPTTSIAGRLARLPQVQGQQISDELREFPGTVTHLISRWPWIMPVE